MDTDTRSGTVGGTRLRCSKGKRFLASVKDPDALEKTLDTAISSIKRILFPSPVPLFSTSSHGLNALGGIRFYVQNRIYQVSSRIWHLNFPRGLHGRYTNRKIFLKEENWCRKTLYHEALHGLSIFSVPSVYQSVGQRHLFLSEGLTEFLTGYILLKDHKECYNAWKKGTFKECRLSSYKRMVKLWCTFCNFIKLEEVIKLYFWDSAGSWNGRYAQFLTAIHNAGYPNFRDVLTLGGNTEILFTQECMNNFEDFEDILDSRKSLDFTRIKV